MTEEQPPLPIETPPPPPPEPERYPFWGYMDLMFVAGLSIPSILLGMLVVRGVMWVMHWHAVLPVEELLPEQVLGYVFLFVAVAAMFRAQYDRPVWRSLGWVRSRVPFGLAVVSGIAAAIVVAFASQVLQTPDKANPMTEMMQDRTSLILLTIFGVGIAPVAEELAFRGFLQPLLVRTFGVVLGIAGAAIPFGLLHFHEYGNSWRHAVVISLAGVGFGIMRQATGSTRAAALMHASYNGFLFIALFSQRKDLPHLW